MRGSRSGVLSVLLIGIGALCLLPAPVAAQTAIDWDAANIAPSPIDGDGTYTGTHDGSPNGIPWTLVIESAERAYAQPDDTQMLRSKVGSISSQATYTLSFALPVEIVFHNDTATGGTGGLAVGGNETVEIVDGYGRYTMVDNSIAQPGGIPAVSGAASNPPVISFDAGNWKAESNISDHAYYKVESLGARTTLQWTHTHPTGKNEVWRVIVSPCGIDWDQVTPPVAGNGTYMGPGFTLTVTNANEVSPHGTLLRGKIGSGGSSTATYSFSFDQWTDVTVYNWVFNSWGGLARGLGNETFEIVAGNGFTLVDNSSNVTPVPGANAYSPQITGLLAESNPAGDHAYYLAAAQAQSAFSWTHSNSEQKSEVWRVCLSPSLTDLPPPVPSLSFWGVVGQMLGLVACAVVVLGRRGLRLAS